jgi:hypothetical protein
MTGGPNGTSGKDAMLCVSIQKKDVAMQRLVKTQCFASPLPAVVSFDQPLLLNWWVKTPTIGKRLASLKKKRCHATSLLELYDLVFCYKLVDRLNFLQFK